MKDANLEVMEIAAEAMALQKIELVKFKELNKELLTLISEIKICLDSGVEINPTSLFHSQINLLVDKYVSLT